jgi:hypothetical protein
MITVILPANHKPDWVGIKVDGSCVGLVWAHIAEAKFHDSLNRFQVRLCGESGVSDAFIWADAISYAE